MSKKKKIIIFIIILFSLIFIGLLGWYLYYLLFLKNNVEFEGHPPTPYDYYYEDSDFLNTYKDDYTRWIYALYDEENINTNDYTIVTISRYTDNEIDVDLYDKKNESLLSPTDEYSNHFELDEDIYSIKTNTEQTISFNKNNEQELILKLVKKEKIYNEEENDDYEEDMKENEYTSIELYENIINKLNNSSNLTEIEKTQLLAFSIKYLNIGLSDKEATLADVGYRVAISKERINELLKSSVCSKKYQINDFSKLKKTDQNSFDNLSNLNENKYSGSKEEFLKMYIIDITPSGIDRSRSKILFDQQITKDNTMEKTYYKVTNNSYNSKDNLLSTVKVRIKNINGQKCLDY